MTPRSLHALQQPDGGFLSFVSSPRGLSIDCNGFTAATVLRLTRHVAVDEDLAEIRHQALTFLTTCVSDDAPPAFGFWPARHRPAWADGLPADADDTAMAVTELYRHGWLDRAEVLRTFCHALLPGRVPQAGSAVRPRWIRTGSFATWLTVDDHLSRDKPNVVDCVVNANIAALMALTDLSHLPGYDEAVAAVTEGLAWAEDDAGRLRTLTPFYPSRRSLLDACVHAVESGVTGLTDAVGYLRVTSGDDDHSDDRCCSDAYGSTVWRCPAVTLSRALAQAG